jgi:hypothetical protein
MTFLLSGIISAIIIVIGQSRRDLTTRNNVFRIHERNDQENYIHYPFAPNALYQSDMMIETFSGKLGSTQESSGIGSDVQYDGILGITLDRTEQYAFMTTGAAKKIRKLNIQTREAGSDITGIENMMLT